MTQQYLSFFSTGSVGDSDENNTTSIKPVVNGENGDETVFNRPHENLRHRTEVLRGKADDQLYVNDADRAVILTGGGNVAWGGTVASSGTGIFTISSNLKIRPFLATTTSIPGTVSITDVTDGSITPANYTILARGITTSYTDPTTSVVNKPARAYSGVNKVTIRLHGTSGATLLMTVSGAPADNFDITYDSNASTGTTLNALISYVTTSNTAGPVAFRALGLEMVLGGSAVGTNKIKVPGADYTFTIAGAVDAEQHIVTPTGLATFFTDTANKLVEGDTLAVSYSVLNDGSRSTITGRRQSLPDAPESNTNVDNNLFLIRRVPTQIAYALPIATVENGDLVFSNGMAITKLVPAALTIRPTPASNTLTYAGGPNWADGTTNPATTIVSQLTKIVHDLSDPSVDGMSKISGLGDAYFLAGTLREQMLEISTNQIFVTTVFSGNLTATTSTQWLSPGNNAGTTTLTSAVPGCYPCFGNAYVSIKGILLNAVVADSSTLTATILIDNIADTHTLTIPPTIPSAFTKSINTTVTSEVSNITVTITRSSATGTPATGVTVTLLLGYSPKGGHLYS